MPAWYQGAALSNASSSMLCRLSVRTGSGGPSASASASASVSASAWASPALASSAESHSMAAAADLAGDVADFDAGDVADHSGLRCRQSPHCVVQGDSIRNASFTDEIKVSDDDDDDCSLVSASLNSER